MRLFLTFKFILLSIAIFSQTGTIRGNVTYFFNGHQEKKPDIGAKVYLIETTVGSFIDSESIDRFINGKSSRQFYLELEKKTSYYDSLAKEAKDEDRHQLRGEDSLISINDFYKLKKDFYIFMKEDGVETKEKFDSLDKRVCEIVNKITAQKSPLCTIDAGGSYNFIADSGNYYIFIISKNRVGVTISESKGAIFLTEVNLKENQVIDVNKVFDYD